jgi:hypothetical protein
MHLMGCTNTAFVCKLLFSRHDCMSCMSACAQTRHSLGSSYNSTAFTDHGAGTGICLVLRLKRSPSRSVNFFVPLVPCRNCCMTHACAAVGLSNLDIRCAAIFNSISLCMAAAVVFTCGWSAHHYQRVLALEFPIVSCHLVTQASTSRYRVRIQASLFTVAPIPSRKRAYQLNIIS